MTACGVTAFLTGDLTTGSGEFCDSAIKHCFYEAAGHWYEFCYSAGAGEEGYVDGGQFGHVDGQVYRIEAGRCGLVLKQEYRLSVIHFWVPFYIQ